MNEHTVLWQKTIRKEVVFSGKGLFSGKRVSLRLIPAHENHRIVFCRTDLQRKPLIPANLRHVMHTHLSTILGKDEVLIQTVEHLLSALHAYQIDNLLIEVDGPEIPIGDGSGLPFAELIEEAGIVELPTKKRIYCPTHPVYFSHNEVHLVILPAPHFSISYTLHYPHCSVIGAQHLSTVVTSENYKKYIAPARTFAIYEEVAQLLDTKIKGGGLDNAIIVKDNKIFNAEGMRFSDEMARHKVLDLIGDLSLLEHSIQGHVIAIRSGHASNIAFAKNVKKDLKEENADVIEYQANC
ncbi:MAG: UDP-3-O-[3-hydroxymyristoyl] N-acetylglucosamine deacetylase [Parachlamydiales bacterium]|nr:UDP-3-O-[3-hydroxymyristoyl] N-acetylglucosamine deacetylase [Parachlamydiales bacterium]